MTGVLGSQNWLVWALASAGFAALTAIFAKVGVSGLNSDFATLVRTLVILPIVAAIAWGRGALVWPADVSSRSWFFLCVSGAATGASWLCYFRALQLGDAAKVAPVDKLSVVMVALFATAFLGESLSMRNWAGVVLVVGGIVLLAQK